MLVTTDNVPRYTIKIPRNEAITTLKKEYSTLMPLYFDLSFTSAATTIEVTTIECMSENYRGQANLQFTQTTASTISHHIYRILTIWNTATPRFSFSSFRSKWIILKGSDLQGKLKSVQLIFWFGAVVADVAMSVAYAAEAPNPTDRAAKLLISCNHSLLRE